MSERHFREPDGDDDPRARDVRERGDGRSDRFDELAEASRSPVVSLHLARTASRLRDVLAAAAGADREATSRLAAGLASDAEAMGMNDLCTAAAALADSAQSGGPLGAAALDLARAHQEMRERLRRDSRPGNSP